jgi:hypothetical protein
MCYVRYAHDNIHDDILFCRILPTQTGEEIFHTIDSYINSGVLCKVKKVAPDMNWVHYFIHREALDSKEIPPEFKTVLDSAVKLVNFIVLCDEMGSEYTQLLLHSEIRWLSWGKVPAKLFQLRHEVLLFVNDSALLLVDEAWLLALSYLSDIFSKLNELNLSLQGKYLAVFNVYENIKEFEKKTGVMD